MTYEATAPATAFLLREDLDRLLDAVRADGRMVVGPTVRDGAVIYDEIASADALPVGWRSDVAPGTYRLTRDHGARAFDYGVPVTSWKRYTHPSRVPLTRTSDGQIEAIEPEAPALAFIGVRACEIAALDIQERVLRAGPAGDVDHARRRDQALVVAVECALASSTCFCTSMGTGPEVTGGADLVLSELDAGFTVRALSEAGEAILSRLALPSASDQQIAAAADQVAGVRSAIGDPVPSVGLAERLRAAPEHPRWDVVAERCLLVLDHAEGLPRRVLPGRLADPRPELVERRAGHRAPRVGDDQDPLDAEQVHAEHQRLQGGVGDPAAGVAEDLGVAVHEPEHPQRVDPRVHAGHQRDPGVGDAVEAAEREVVREEPVGGEQVVELGVHGPER